jgi:hypothetical protein
MPRPPRGYWAQIAVGRTPKKPPLPPAGPTHELEWPKGDGSWTAAAWVAPEAPKERPADTARSVGRPSRTPHRLIAGARIHFEKVLDSDNGYLRPYKKHLVDVYVSKEGLEGALAFGNQLLGTFEQRGYMACLAPANVRLQRPELDERTASNPRCRTAVATFRHQRAREITLESRKSPARASGTFRRFFGCPISADPPHPSRSAQPSGCPVLWARVVPSPAADWNPVHPNATESARGV